MDALPTLLELQRVNSGRQIDAGTAGCLQPHCCERAALASGARPASSSSMLATGFCSPVAAAAAAAFTAAAGVSAGGLLGEACCSATARASAAAWAAAPPASRYSSRFSRLSPSWSKARQLKWPLGMPACCRRFSTSQASRKPLLSWSASTKICRSSGNEASSAAGPAARNSLSERRPSLSASKCRQSKLSGWMPAFAMTFSISCCSRNPLPSASAALKILRSASVANSRRLCAACSLSPDCLGTASRLINESDASDNKFAPSAPPADGASVAVLLSCFSECAPADSPCFEFPSLEFPCFADSFVFLDFLEAESESASCDCLPSGCIVVCCVRKDCWDSHVRFGDAR